MKTSEKILKLHAQTTTQFPERTYVGKDFSLMDLQKELIAIHKEVLTLEQNSGIVAPTIKE